jgi:hypothetical protein
MQHYSQHDRIEGTFLEKLPPPYAEALIMNHRGFVRGRLGRASLSETAALTTLDVYLRQRAITGGYSTSVGLLRWANTVLLSETILESAPVHEMTQIACELLALTNVRLSDEQCRDDS